mmetsp:Transcript_33088/g.78613  ORF Transcript_33088/g.78613 Transcript_33088/m.78613 type:complete len:590 (+) Transcript_33088:327-2096(+)
MWLMGRVMNPQIEVIVVECRRRIFCQNRVGGTIEALPQAGYAIFGRVKLALECRHLALHLEDEIDERGDKVVRARLDEERQVGHVALGHLLRSHNALAPLVHGRLQQMVVLTLAAAALLLHLARDGDHLAPEREPDGLGADLRAVLRVVGDDAHQPLSRELHHLEELAGARRVVAAQLDRGEDDVLPPTLAADEHLAVVHGLAPVHDVELARRHELLGREEADLQRARDVELEAVARRVQEPDALRPARVAPDDHLAVQRGRHVDEQLLIGLLAPQRVEPVEVLAQPLRHVWRHLFDAHEGVEVIHLVAEDAQARVEVGDDAAEHRHSVRPEEARAQHQAARDRLLLFVPFARGDVAVADGGDRHRGPVDRGRVHAATAHARPTVEARQIRGVEPVGYVLVRDACAPAAWRLLPPKLGGALRNHRDPVGLLVWAGHDQSRVELEGHIGRREAVAVVHEPRRGKGHASEALAELGLQRPQAREPVAVYDHLHGHFDEHDCAVADQQLRLQLLENARRREELGEPRQAYRPQNAQHLELADDGRVLGVEQRSDDVHQGDDEREQIDEEPAGFVVPCKQLLGLHDPSHALYV